MMQRRSPRRKTGQTWVCAVPFAVVSAVAGAPLSAMRLAKRIRLNAGALESALEGEPNAGLSFQITPHGELCSVSSTGSR